jgi:hypothetical protein
MTRPFRTFFAAMLLLGAGTASAQQLVSGDLILHYSALPTLQLQPEVARQYGLTRSAGRALLNVAVRRTQADGSDIAVAATVSASATNLAGQRQDLRMREVREGDAIYYLAEARISDGETLRFELSATVDGAPRPLAVRFQQDFYTPR